ncbi:MAG TPA: hypothetical protein VGJ87_15535, partial [Roseiflexaceae bacterium]
MSARFSGCKALLAVIALGVAGCGLIGMLIDRPSSGTRLAEAKARWVARPFSEYRLVIQEQTRGGTCDQDVQIQDEQIQRVFQNGCVRLPSWTISNLFTWAEQLADYKIRCYPTDVTCVCHAIYTKHAVFDPHLGYPQSVIYEWQLQPNWAYLNHW